MPHVSGSCARHDRKLRGLHLLAGALSAHFKRVGSYILEAVVCSRVAQMIVKESFAVPPLWYVHVTGRALVGRRSRYGYRCKEDMWVVYHLTSLFVGLSPVDMLA